MSESQDYDGIPLADEPVPAQEQDLTGRALPPADFVADSDSEPAQGSATTPAPIPISVPSAQAPVTVSVSPTPTPAQAGQRQRRGFREIATGYARPAAALAVASLLLYGGCNLAHKAADKGREIGSGTYHEKKHKEEKKVQSKNKGEKAPADRTSNPDLYLVKEITVSEMRGQYGKTGYLVIMETKNYKGKNVTLTVMVGEQEAQLYRGIQPGYQVLRTREPVKAIRGKRYGNDTFGSGSFNVVPNPKKTAYNRPEQIMRDSRMAQRAVFESRNASRGPKGISYRC